MIEKSTALVDYLAFTIKDGNPEDHVKHLKETMFCGQTWSPYRLHGFEHGIKCPCAVILWNSDRNRCVHVQLSGSACRAAEAHGMIHDWQDFLRNLITRGVTIKRLDLAIDDREGILSMDMIRTAASSRHFISRMRCHSLQADYDHESRMISDGCTFGSPTSDTRVRFYDKALQQNIEGHWIRCELQLRDERAHAAAEHLAHQGFIGSSGMIADCLDFRVPSSCRRDRWKRAKWWTEFLGCIERIAFGTAPRDQSLARARANFFRLARSFAMVYDEEGQSFVDSLLAEGHKRLGRSCHRSQFVA